mmetsp:Transcript_8675/g.18742  ORF Transcript_8675/g.18742 Transcript_8675/m.18742 type:complete len:148 (-) Transcript_8675:130-573(-)
MHYIIITSSQKGNFNLSPRVCSLSFFHQTQYHELLLATPLFFLLTTSLSISRQRSTSFLVIDHVLLNRRTGFYTSTMRCPSLKATTILIQSIDYNPTITISMYCTSEQCCAAACDSPVRVTHNIPIEITAAENSSSLTGHHICYDTQ